MTDEQTALARRVVACKGFRWMRGMLRQNDYRYVGSGVWAKWARMTSLTTALHSPDQWPDLTDPATLGCLLALVREAWGDPKINVVPFGASVWAVAYAGWLHKKAIACGATEAEALVAALEGAP